MKQINRLLQNRNDPDDMNYTISGYFYMANLLTHILMQFLVMYLGMGIVAVCNIFPMLLFPLCIFLNHIGKCRLAILLAILELIVFASLSTMTGGWELGFYLYLFAVVAVCFFTSALNISSKIGITILA